MQSVVLMITSEIRISIKVLHFDIGQRDQSDCAILSLSTWDKGNHIWLNGYKLGYNYYNLIFDPPLYQKIRTAHPIPSDLEHYYFEVKIIRCSNDDEIIIGLYKYLKGQERSFVGYRSHEGDILHLDAEDKTSVDQTEKYTVGDVIGCSLHRITRENLCYDVVQFTKNGLKMGPTTYLNDPKQLQIKKSQENSNDVSKFDKGKLKKESLKNEPALLNQGLCLEPMQTLYPAIGFLGLDLEVETNFGCRNFLYCLKGRNERIKFNTLHIT